MVPLRLYNFLLLHVVLIVRSKWKFFTKKTIEILIVFILKRNEFIQVLIPLELHLTWLEPGLTYLILDCRRVLSIFGVELPRILQGELVLVLRPNPIQPYLPASAQPLPNLQLQNVLVRQAYQSGLPLPRIRLLG